MACLRSSRARLANQLLLALVLVHHPIWLFAQTADKDAYERLAQGMPAGAQRILHEKSDPPEAPLRLISFRDANRQQTASGKASYGVNPLEMSLLKLKSQRPDVRVGVDISADSRPPEASSDLSVKAIHRHVDDTVQFHGGTPDESVTPGVKPPGVHVLDTVTRTLSSSSKLAFKNSLPRESSSEGLSRAIDNLETVKPLLFDDGSTFVAPAQAVLEKVKALKLGNGALRFSDESTPKVVDQIPGESDPKVADQIPDESDPKVVDQIPDESGPKVVDQIAGESDPKVADQIPDESDPKVADQIPDESDPTVVDQIPDESGPEIVDRISDESGPKVADQIPGESGPKVADQIPDESGPKVADQIPDESDPKVADQIPDESGPMVINRIPDESNLEMTDQISEISKAALIERVGSVTKPVIENSVPDQSRTNLCDQIARGASPNASGTGRGPALDFNEDCQVGNNIAAVSTPSVTKQAICEQIAHASSVRPKNAGKSRPVRFDEGCKATFQPITDEIARIEKKIGAEVSSEAVKTELKEDLDGMASKIASAVGAAFDNVEKQLKAQGSEERSKADQVNVPEKKCRIIKLGLCWGGETSKSQADRKSAQAEKDSHNKTADQFFKAADQMPVKKVAAQASIYQKFAGAESAIDNGLSPSLSVPSTTVSDSAKDSGGADNSSHGTRSDNGHRSEVNNESAEVALVTIGSETLVYVVKDIVNAAIGYEAIAEQHIADIGGDAGSLTVNSAIWLLGSDDVASINAAIGDHSVARQLVDSIYDELGVASVGQATFFTQNVGEINVALGSRSRAEMIVSSLMGSVKGSFDATSFIITPINVSMGHDTQSTMHLGAWQGNVETKGTLFLQPTAALAAAIGESTSATVRLASQHARGRADVLDISVTSEGSLAAPLGYRAEAHIEMGNVDGQVGQGNIIVVTGPVISAALGSRTIATNRVANLQEGKRVRGQYRNHAYTGALLAFSLGDDTRATNAIGSVEANVGGDATIHVKAGEVATGTVGERTTAETYIGSVLADVTGDVDINIVVGAINTFAVGLSNSKEIYAKTYIGNVISPQKDVDINVKMDGVFNLGYGLVLDFGALGTLDLSRQGCVSVGNYGPSPC
ncbi:hypothetical protein OAO91_03445 [Luminiphilus sp.]|nr:hypothetical protein [Luminiphilus sp.]